MASIVCVHLVRKIYFACYQCKEDIFKSLSNLVYQCEKKHKTMTLVISILEMFLENPLTVLFFIGLYLVSFCSILF